MVRFEVYSVPCALGGKVESRPAAGAIFYSSTDNMRLNQPVVGMSLTKVVTVRC